MAAEISASITPAFMSPYDDLLFRNIFISMLKQFCFFIFLWELWSEFQNEKLKKKKNVNIL